MKEENKMEDLFNKSESGFEVLEIKSIYELLMNKEELAFYKNFLIIRKRQEVEVENEIGKIYKEYNIVVCDPPEYEVNIDTLYKIYGYAHIYKAELYKKNNRDEDNLTISLIVYEKPDELFSQIENGNMSIEKAYDGIYYIKNPFMATQIIVVKELNKENHSPLHSLYAQHTQ